MTQLDPRVHLTTLTILISDIMKGMHKPAVITPGRLLEPAKDLEHQEGWTTRPFPESPLNGCEEDLTEELRTHGKQ